MPLKCYQQVSQTSIFATMNKWWSLLLFTIIFYSCSSDTNQIDPTTVFRYNEHANITSLDPAFSKDQRNIWACNLIYNGLVKLDNELQVVSDIADNWEVSIDGRTYNFKLKDSIYFHENSAFAKANSSQTILQKVTASDFKYSLERLTDPRVASPGAWVMSNVKSISAPADNELIIELNQPFPAFLGLLTMKYCSVIPEASRLKPDYDQRSNPIGTGPFYMKRWEENVKLVLRKNEHYFETDEKGEPLPYLEAVAITFKNDKQSEFLEFAQGNLDFINALDPSYKDELLTTQGELKPAYVSSVNMIKAPFLNTEYLGLQLDSETPELQSLKLRRAINLGFDRVQMIKYLRNNIGTPATSGFIPAGLPAGGQIKGFEYDPMEARILVNEYIRETGDENPQVVISTNANYLDLCEYIQKELEKAGIDVAVEVMPPSTLRQARSAGQLDAFRSSWIADYPDAENYLSLFYSENFAPNGPNYTHFSNEKYDELYEQALAIPDPKQREELYIKMDSLIIENAAIVPLYYDQSVRFISKNVHGLETNGINILDLTRVYKTAD
ncbi:peptide/nickel transport system substrate-binding protein [Nonlabens sp. Hel1_33_55]|uniref:ABC transporter substrate-binding protein n=1 Tax=Nonlabens sp. Hel1_33_55 TaxID=1336802 RepID=UPI000875C566|nr:ABC transporter substrate-binding protein [Nonlabens sp. Hel1_33_55]SCY05993.1 peptide/nickel transport system substrate-binding protein [Nonlabens sp. Hel1_33_55]